MRRNRHCGLHFASPQKISVFLNSFKELNQNLFDNLSSCDTVPKIGPWTSRNRSEENPQ